MENCIPQIVNLGQLDDTGLEQYLVIKGAIPLFPNVNGYVYNLEEYNRFYNSDKYQELINKNQLSLTSGISGDGYEDRLQYINTPKIINYTVGTVREISQFSPLHNIYFYVTVDESNKSIIDHITSPIVGMMYTCNRDGIEVSDINYIGYDISTTFISSITFSNQEKYYKYIPEGSEYIHNICSEFGADVDIETIQVQMIKNHFNWYNTLFHLCGGEICNYIDDHKSEVYRMLL